MAAGQAGRPGIFRPIKLSWRNRWPMIGFPVAGDCVAAILNRREAMIYLWQSRALPLFPLISGAPLNGNPLEVIDLSKIRCCQEEIVLEAHDLPQTNRFLSDFNSSRL
jgi:hypothetical protein